MTLRIKVVTILLLLTSTSAIGGEQIAFLALTDGYWEVWICDPDGNSSRQITRLGNDVSRVSWFPDGRHLFVNRHDGRWARVATLDGETTDIEAPLAGSVDAVLSPDGRYVAFSVSTGGSIDDNDIWLFEMGRKQLRKLTQMPRLQHEPAWSPDGRNLYFLSGDGGQAHDIWRVSVDSTQVEQITVNNLYHFDVAVAPDGRLAFSSNRSGNYEIWLLEQNTQATVLTDDPALDARPSWSSDSLHIAFESSRDSDLSVFVMDSRSRHIERIGPEGLIARLPVWSPATEALQ